MRTHRRQSRGGWGEADVRTLLPDSAQCPGDLAGSIVYGPLAPAKQSPECASIRAAITHLQLTLDLTDVTTVAM
ncbi:MAG: hypothetical protein QOJ15_2484 [Bradyrhizobium sp.]|jgi:hypothetical protein|nr:hypothetical protein [Bradyrhizobium sp.]